MEKITKIVIIVIAVIVIGIGTGFFAYQNGVLARDPEIPEDEAIAIAEEYTGGEVVRVNVEKEGFTTVYEISVENERADLGALDLARGDVLRTDDGRHFRWDHMPVRVHRDQHASTFEAESNAAPGRCRPGRAAQSQRFALQIEKLFGIDLAAFFVDGLEQATFRGCKRFDFCSDG